MCYSVNSIPKGNKKNKTRQRQRLSRNLALAAATYAGYGDEARAAYITGAKTIKYGKKALALANTFRRTKKPKSKPKISSTTLVSANVNPQMRLFSQPSGRGLNLSSPAMLYLKSFVVPFDASVKSVGIPRPGSMPSYKVTGFVRGVGYIGLQGFGYVAFAPTLCNDRFCVSHSGTNFNLSLVASMPTDTQGASANSPAVVQMTNLPYTYSQLTTTTTGDNSASTVEGRIVSASLRTYYTGTTFNQSGQYYGYVDPDFESVVGNSHVTATPQTVGYTVGSLGAKDATEIKGADRQGMYIVWVPPYNNLNDYPANNSSPWRKAFPYCNNLFQGPVADGIGAANGVICVTGVAGQSFYWEAILHAEYIGPGVPQSLLSQSYADTVGFDSVQMLLGRAQRRCAADARKTFKECIIAEAAMDGIRF